MKCEECECVKNERGIAYNRHGLYLCWDCMHNGKIAGAMKKEV